jgi:serine/threonine protein kinase
MLASPCRVPTALKICVLRMIEITGYRLLRQLGRGGMATVYLALQESVDREVALKVMSPALLADPTYGERFLREARIAARLHHRHVVGVHDVGKSGDLHYIAMEYLAGGPILKKDGGPRDVPFALRVVREIATALAYAHSKGFVHRDIKPDNVLLRDDGTAALTDFGIARASDSATRMTRTGAVIGTPHYMSPEQARGKPIDGRADLYSLGVVMYELLVGRVPYHAEDSLAVGIMHITEPIPALPEHLSSLQPLLEVMLAKKPEERYQSGEELSMAIREYEVAIAKGELPSLMTPSEEESQAILSALPPLKSATPQEPMRPISSSPLPETRPIEQPLPPTRPLQQPSAARREPSAPRTEVPQRAEPSLGRIEDFAAAMDNTRLRHQQEREKPRSRAGVWLTVLVLLIGGVGAAVYFNQDKLRSFIPNSGVSAMLVKAQQSFDEGKYYGGPGTAEDWYKSVLKEDPDNTQAREGLKRVGQALLRDGQAALLNGDLKHAKELAAPAKELYGGVEVENLELKIRDTENRQTKYGELLDKAQNALAAGQLSGAPESAATYFQRVLDLDPSNAIARKGINDVLAALAAQARSGVLARRNDEASARIADIERISPTYPGLAELKALVSDTKNKDAQDLEAKLTQAEVYSRKGQLIHPPGANALELYKQVIAKDPQNAKAKAGLATAARALIGQANASLSAHDLEAATRALNQAEAAGASNAEVSILRVQVREEQEKRDIATKVVVPDAEQQAKIDKFLADADTALAAGDLIDPPFANAYDLYRAAMGLDRNNARAKAGIAAIVPKAKELFEKALASGAPNTARSHLDALLQVAPSDAAAAGFKQRLGHVYVQQAEKLIADNQKVAAAQALNKARELAPGDPSIAEVEAKLQ